MKNFKISFVEQLSEETAKKMDKGLDGYAMSHIPS